MKTIKTTLSKELHERALAIIELIELADRRIERHKKEVPSVFFNIQDYADKRITSLKAAKNRLHKSYRETITRINQAK